MRALWIGAAVAMVLGAASAQQRFTFEDLLQRLVEPAWLHRSPEVGERCVQWSSFDRASLRGPADPAAWYANNDRGHYVRAVGREGHQEHVLVDATGPGAIARVWSANPSGTLHFDIDGARVWSVDFALLCSGKHERVPEPLAGMRSRGGNCYLPIPFQKSLVVSCTARDLYYAVDVLQFAPGTTVPSFSPRALVEHATAIAATAKDLAVGLLPMAVFDDAPPLAAVTLTEPATVTVLQVFAHRRAAQASFGEAVAGVRLVVREADEVLVDVPLAAFFAGGPDWRPWAGRLLEVGRDSATSRWPMPLPRGGHIELVGAAAVVGFDLGVQVRTVPLPRGPDEPLRFRASYHLQKAIPTRPFRDHVVLDAKGQGRFVGCSLLVRNPSKIWWGEGDEKFTVDGEAFPSWFGTGTEDYFGYAWCDPTPFAAPFHAQVECQGPMNFGLTQLHRTHLLDSVPFQRSFRFDLEVWHWVESASIDYATVAYWYGAAGATSGLPPVPAAAACELPRLELPPRFVAEGALEGEALRVVACTAGQHEVQDLGIFERTFSQDAHRWWRDGKVGDALVLAVPVPAAGRYRVTAAFVMADDFAIVQGTLAGQALGAPFDGYAERVSSSGPRELGIVELVAGDAELRLQIIGRNNKAKASHMVGLDYLRLETMR